ncbi:hypothetical protein B0H10DRAFT_285076 [Mycena sp. CBHHK59/15]|nr:hypothetical protein B0H10DRAFT_285076 [Mycena sp. CBHHK59/15]
MRTWTWHLRATDTGLQGTRLTSGLFYLWCEAPSAPPSCIAIWKAAMTPGHPSVLAPISRVRVLSQLTTNSALHSYVDAGEGPGSTAVALRYRNWCGPHSSDSAWRENVSSLLTHHCGAVSDCGVDVPRNTATATLRPVSTMARTTTTAAGRGGVFVLHHTPRRVFAPGEKLGRLRSVSLLISSSPEERSPNPLIYENLLILPAGRGAVGLTLLLR